VFFVNALKKCKFQLLRRLEKKQVHNKSYYFAIEITSKNAISLCYQQSTILELLMAENEKTMDTQEQQKDAQEQQKDAAVEQEVSEEVSTNEMAVESNSSDDKSASTDSKESPVETAENTIKASSTDQSKSQDNQEKSPLSLDELTKQLAEAKFKAEKHWDTVLRQRAETENVRKRMERELDKVRKYALEKFANELLPVVDSMELGLAAAEKPETEIQAVRDGLALTLKMFTDVLKKFDIVEVNPQDEKFDPQLHEAMTLQTVPNVPDNTVIYVHQKGYQLNNRLLRPARVVVSKSP